MKPEVKHSPTPFSGDAKEGKIFNAAGSEIAYAVRQDDIPFIVSACNAHEALVEVLTAFVNLPSSNDGRIDPRSPRGLVIAQAKAALKMANTGHPHLLQGLGSQGRAPSRCHPRPSSGARADAGGDVRGVR